jgi:hypothetical protein
MLKQETVRAIMAEDYPLGARLEAAGAFLREARQRQMERAQATETARTLAARVESARQELEDEHSQWENALAEFRQGQERLRKELLAKHDEEQRAYETKWGLARSVMPYAKPSRDLLQLQRVHKVLALTRRFDEAGQVLSEAEAMQAVETRRGEERAKASICTGYDQLLEKQRKELACFDGHERRTLEFLEQERQNGETPLVMLIRALEGPAGKLTQEQVDKGRKERKKRLQRAVVVPPKLQTRFKDFRGGDDPPKLPLDRQGIKKFAAHRRQRIIGSF